MADQAAGKALCPWGTKPAWQVSYVRNGVEYWWDYADDSLMRDLEKAKDDDWLLGF